MKYLSYEQIQEIIKNNKLRSISDLCAQFKSDYISVIIGAFELGLDYSDFLSILIKTAHFDIDEYLLQISAYPFSIQKILIPKSVKSATALFLLAQDYYQEMSKNIISEVINESNYLEDVKNENIFIKNNIVFLAVNIDFKSEIPYLYQIQQKLKSLNLIFITESEKDFYELYRLNEFHQINKFSIKQIDRF